MSSPLGRGFSCRPAARVLPKVVTVAHTAGHAHDIACFVLARSGFNHSIDYRSVMAFGHARLLDDGAEKERALAMMVDRLFPGRTGMLRPTTTQEVKATSVVWMEIEKASAKVRAKGVADDEEDYDLPIYAERLPVLTTLGAPEPCPRLKPGVGRPESLGLYSAGRALDEALRQAHAKAYPGD